MSKFILERSVNVKKKVILPIGLVSLFFLNTFLLRNPFTSGILIAGIIIFMIYSFITERKPYIEFHRDTLEFYKPSGRMLFSESIRNLKIRKIDIRVKNALIGLAVSFTASDGTEISIGTYRSNKKWLNTAEVMNEVKYIMNPVKWDLFIDQIGLGSQIKGLEKNGLEMQQLTKFRNTFQNKIFWWILMGAGIFILIFGVLSAWLLYISTL
jgi:hypothetical protein